jgi:hypothetical protein
MGDTRSTDCIGRPLAYARARLMPMAQAVLTADVIHQDYMSWCTTEALVPLKAGPFREALGAICRAVPIAVHTDAGELVLLDTSFRHLRS